MHQLLRIITYLFLLTSCLVCHSQISRNDSIQNYFKQIEVLIDKTNHLKKETSSNDIFSKKDDIEEIKKVKTLLNRYTFHKYKSTDDARKYNNQALQLSLKIGYKKGELQAKYNEAYLLFVTGYFDQSADLLDKANSLINYNSFSRIYSDILCLESLIHSEKGEYDIALDISLKLLDLGEKDNNPYVLMKAHGALLHYYLRKKKYSQALNHCLKGLDYTIKIEETQYLFFKIDEIARLLFKLGDIKEALKTYEFYLNLENKMKPPGDYIQSIVYMNMSEIYASNNQLDDAQNYITKALALNYKNDFRFRIPRALVLQAEIYLQVNDTINAIDFYEQSLSAAEDINAFDVVRTTSKILGEIYDKRGEASKAFEYLTLHKSIKDSLFSNEKEQKIIILEARRKIKEITQKKEILTLENDAQKAKLRTIISILIGVLVLSLIVLFSYLKVKSKNKLLYIKTVELAKIQLEMRHKIDELKRLKPKVKEKKTVENSNSGNILDDNVKTIILNKLNKLEANLFFVDQNCTLGKLAEQLKTNPKYLSQVINQEKQSNFNNYINELRINHLLTRLLKEKDFRESKLSYIAASSGYNNLNTFNTAFKKRQGILPSYFIKELIQESEGELT